MGEDGFSVAVGVGDEEEGGEEKQEDYEQEGDAPTGDGGGYLADESTHFLGSQVEVVIGHCY